MVAIAGLRRFCHRLRRHVDGRARRRRRGRRRTRRRHLAWPSCTGSTDHRRREDRRRATGPCATASFGDCRRMCSDHDVRSRPARPARPGRRTATPCRRSTSSATSRGDPPADVSSAAVGRDRAGVQATATAGDRRGQLDGLPEAVGDPRSMGRVRPAFTGHPETTGGILRI